MDIKVLIPPARDDTRGAPSIFLGGSITGAADWQSVAIRLLREAGFKGWIFNPRREEAFSEEPGIWKEQVDWEREYLRKATVILFWLPKGADALTSRWEIAEFAAKGRWLVVGIEDGVRRKKYIQYVLRKEYLKAIVCDSLEEVCLHADFLAQQLFHRSIPISSAPSDGGLQELLEYVQRDWDLEQGPDDFEM